MLDPRVMMIMMERFWPTDQADQRGGSTAPTMGTIPWELQRFRDLTKATVFAHAVAVGAVMDHYRGSRKTATSGQNDPHPPDGGELLPLGSGGSSSEGFIALSATGQPRPTRTMAINLGKSGSFESPLSEGIGCIRHSESIVACTVGNSEIHVFQIDGGKRAASTSKPCKRQCELLDIPPMNSSSAQDLLIHAGDGALFWRDLHDPNLDLLGRVPLGRTEHRERSSWLAGLSMDIPDRQVVVGRSSGLPGCFPQCLGSMDVFDLETRELMASWDLPWESGGLVALDRVTTPAFLVGTTGDSAVAAWDARIGERSMVIGTLSAPPMPRTIAQKGHIVAVGTASDSATLFDVRRPGSPLVTGLGGHGLPCSHVAFSASTFTAWCFTDESGFVSVYDLSSTFTPVVQLAGLQRQVTAVSQPAKRSLVEDLPSIPTPEGPPLLCVLGVRRPKHSGKGGMKHELCIVTDASDDGLADGRREIDVGKSPLLWQLRQGDQEFRFPMSREASFTPAFWAWGRLHSWASYKHARP
ncbi:hypothetical protein FOL46_003193 [Perkinsus olseni]|uniref:Uncharacterized protein n=1 Tax=Perkinsus olseni TaxID=32597 RepID=A0A7J6M3X1_PEROL|nr:hypothetical protein FOL46_003193 [Perkinsus olseni]